MRHAMFALVCLAAACGQTTAPAIEASPSAPAPVFALESEAVIGRWSFDRTCGLYDLVFEADGRASYFDYSTDTVVSHVGTWSTADGNRVVLTTRVQNVDGALGADIETYNLDVSAPVTDDLVGRFTEARDISAKRCDETEDRE